MIVTVAALGKKHWGRRSLCQCLLAVALMMGFSLSLKAQVQPLPPFAAGLEQWKQVSLNDQVAPNIFVARLWDGRQAIEIQSSNSMSLLATEVAVDLLQTPYLCWWWRVDGALKTADMQSKAGDDYAARLYISVQLPPDQIGFGRRLQLGLARAIWGDNVPDGAVNYVWDNTHPIGHEQANAYTDLARMLVLQTGNTEAGRWVAQYRNVREDIARLFGSDAKVVQVAITADTDNTGESARAGFAELRFADDPKHCSIE
jgi:hypothetical protein